MIVFHILVLLLGCRGYLNPEPPESKSITDNFVDFWWEINAETFGYSACFILQEEEDTGFAKHPIFLKKPASVDEELFGTWNFMPPNTFHIYEDGEDPPYELEIYESSNCWTLDWGSMTEVVCSCSF
tara:strand:+ start:305 stop:685 length:381 start_codon:yes stop_codon:yes gene_type:complete